MIVSKNLLAAVVSCALIPLAIMAIGVIDAEVELHDSLPISGTLAEWGYLDVTASGYGADKTGAANSTAAIQKAINDAYTNNMVVFFPSGTYKVNNSIDCWQPLYSSNSGASGSQLRHANVLVGSTLGDGVTIKLDDNADGFGSDSSKKNLFQFWCANAANPTTKDTAFFDAARHYNAEMRNFKINLGTGNPGAIAIWMQGAQGCNIQNVDIDVNSGFAGIASLVGAGSGHAQLTLRNGKYGVWCDADYMGQAKASQPMPYLAGCTFINQSESAIYLNNINGTLTLIGFRIDMTNVNKKAIVLYDSYGDAANSLNLVDGTIQMAGTSSVAVANDGKKSVNIENVFIKAKMLVDCTDNDGDESGSSTAWKKIASYSYIGQDGTAESLKCNHAQSWSNAVEITTIKRSTVSNSTPSAVDCEKLVAAHLWKCDFPTFEDEDCHIADELDGTGSEDVTFELQALIDSYDKVFLPKGTYKISDTITLKRDTALFGVAKNLSIIQMDPVRVDPGPENTFYMIDTVDEAASQNILAFLEFQQNNNQTNIASVHWLAGKQSIIRNIQQWYGTQGNKPRNQADFLFSGKGGGKLYNFHHTYSILPGDDAGSAPAGLRFQGVCTPTYVYGLSSETAWVNGQLDILDSRDVYIVSYKDENTWEVNHSCPTNPKYIKTAINNSTNIGFYGLQNLIHGPQTDEYSTVVFNSTDIAMVNLARVQGSAAETNPAACHMFYQDAPELRLTSLHAISKYELNSYVRNYDGSLIWGLMRTDTFDTLNDHWCGSDGFTLSSDKGKLASGKQDYLGSQNYDNVKVFYDFEDVSGGSPSAFQVLKARIRAQYGNYGDCYEVRLHRDGQLRIFAMPTNGSLVSVTNVATGLANITGATHRMEILAKNQLNGDFTISVLFKTTAGTNYDRTLTWTQPATDMTYKHFDKGTIGFFSASGTTNMVDDFTVKDGRFYAQ